MYRLLVGVTGLIVVGSAVGCMNRYASSPIVTLLPLGDGILPPAEPVVVPVQALKGGSAKRQPGLQGNTLGNVVVRENPTSAAVAAQAAPLPPVELPTPPRPGFWTRVGNLFRKEHSPGSAELARSNQPLEPLEQPVVTAASATPAELPIIPASFPMPTKPAPLPMALPATAPVSAIPPIGSGQPLLGTWYRETAGTLIVLRFTDNRLIVGVTRATTDGKHEARVTLSAEGDYAVGRDGHVFGVVTNIESRDCPEDADGSPSLLLAALALQDEPFALRTRLDQESLTVSSVKCADLGKVLSDEPLAALAVQGKYLRLAQGELPQPKAVKRSGSGSKPACPPATQRGKLPSDAPPMQQPAERRPIESVSRMLTPENLKLAWKFAELLR